MKVQPTYEGWKLSRHGLILKNDFYSAMENYLPAGVMASTGYTVTFIRLTLALSEFFISSE